MISSDERRRLFGKPLDKHSAIPRRVQYLRGLSGGSTSVGMDFMSAM